MKYAIDDYVILGDMMPPKSNTGMFKYGVVVQINQVYADHYGVNLFEDANIFWWVDDSEILAKILIVE